LKTVRVEKENTKEKGQIGMRQFFSPNLGQTHAFIFDISKFFMRLPLKNNRNFEQAKRLIIA